MWTRVGRLAATVWMFRVPIAVCALIFGGLAALNEVGSWHARAAASETAPKACADSHDPQDQQQPSC